VASSAGFENVTVVDHPVIAQKPTELRDKSTRPERFRNLLRDASSLLAAEAPRNLLLTPAM
jgi:uracil phosphoribosyltransferase